MSELNARIQAAIEHFVSQVTTIAREEAAHMILAGLPHLGHSTPHRAKSHSSGGSGGGGGGSGGGGGGKRGRRSAESLESVKKEVLTAIRSQAGIRVEELNAKLGTTTKDLALPIRHLLADKEIRKKGSRRATKYFAE